MISQIDFVLKRIGVNLSDLFVYLSFLAFIRLKSVKFLHELIFQESSKNCKT